MIISAFINYLIQLQVDILKEQNFTKIISVLPDGVSNSYLETGFKGCNTRHSYSKNTRWFNNIIMKL